MCNPVGQKPKKTDVYTVVKFFNLNLFPPNKVYLNDPATKQALAQAFEFSYNSSLVCLDRYSNAFKKIESSSVLKANDEPPSLYGELLIRSQMQTNALPQKTCSGTSVPEMYDTLEFEPLPSPDEDCFCEGPSVRKSVSEPSIGYFRSLFQSTYEEILQLNKNVPFPELSTSLFFLLINQVCVNEECTPGATEITFDNTTVTLPCKNKPSKCKEKEGLIVWKDTKKKLSCKKIKKKGLCKEKVEESSGKLAIKSVPCHVNYLVVLIEAKATQ